ncbi:MAG: HAMP domain-containing histidine kinase [Hyphomicrobiales bacterium]|nr:HAMP domain-containing histidine kinase [Hyphomicrobiales bacterium]MCP4997526.1 HAMP domain-containing histidine kinase [Hyphomicrobiales bacterium]
MLRRRLYLQIYLTIIASLVTVVILSAVMWNVFDRDRAEGRVADVISQLVFKALPDAGASGNAQRAALLALGDDLDIDISLYDSQDQLIAARGTVRPMPRHHDGESGWRRSRGGPSFILNLPDGRTLIADPSGGDGLHPLVNLLIMLGTVAVGVGLAAYPFVRRLTKRLEQLQLGVERMGAGDLGARVDVRGRDEVARLAESFNESAEKIEKLVGAHRMLLANASHELRTPLSRIRLGLEMTQGGQDPERAAALRQDIAELDSLIDEILLMSRLDADANFDLSQTVDLVALAAEECARYDDCELSGSAPDIRGDPRLLHRLLANLLENAFKHGAPPVSVRIASLPDTVTITVGDCGMGIAEQDREKVFQAFYRGSDRQNVNGYGLGLPLVRQIAESHGGSVMIVPKEEERSAIRVSLPFGRGTG